MNIQNYWVSGLCTLGIVNSRKDDVSETRSVSSSGENREGPSLLIPLERANLNHCNKWFGLALSKGPNRVGVFLPSPVDSQ
jgi:hypothetical protein